MFEQPAKRIAAWLNKIAFANDIMKNIGKPAVHA